MFFYNICPLVIMDNVSSSDGELLRVIQVEVLAATADIGSSEEDTSNFQYLPEIPLLNFELENGENFLMANIPFHIAIEIAKRIEGIESADSRLTLSTIVPELCVIERVIIDSVVPFSTAYQATIEVRLEGFHDVQRYQMVPSHATLLAIIAKAPIYVSKQILASSSNRAK